MARKAIGGFIRECSYCGEQVPSGKYCSRCKTREGRTKIFEENVKIFKENDKKGMKVPAGIKDPH